MRCRLIAVGLAFAMIWSTAAFAATSEGYGMGGWMERFQPVIDQANRSGELFRITGHCQSACTTFLGIRNVCVERSASLLFHAAHDRQRVISPRWTAHFMGTYNARLRGYLAAGRYMETLEFHTVSGAAMIDRFGYRECPRR
ncbi:MAG: hypothetical protein JWR80_1621 [Bradyrhizobium sp.]|jgi:hypothetical protein|nr:hypothetical protein [Bradyrhizobium sp.]